MKFIKKHWFFILVIYFCILRAFISWKLPSFFLTSLKFDDALMISNLKSFIAGNYISYYSDTALIKGVIYPLVLFLARNIHLSYSALLTILYMGGSIFLTRSLSKVIKNKVMLLIIFIIILFNPISYSSEVFQRLYVNSLSFIELLYFLGIVINILFKEGNNILNYIFLGLIVTIMYLTRNDSIWVFVILLVVFIYKLIKNFKIKTIIINLIPIIILLLGINTMRFINYKRFNIYTYNELEDSNFKKAYTKMLQIKDDEKIDRVAIPRSTLYKIVDNTDALGITREIIDNYYRRINDSVKELDNGNVVWSLREMVYLEQRFKDGKEANEFFGRLSNELDRLFSEGILEKEFSLPFIYINMPTKSELKKLPKDVLKAMWYTSSYQNIKTYNVDTLNNINEYIKTKYKPSVSAYGVYYTDYRNAEKMGKDNILICEIIRIIYKYLTIILSIPAFIIMVLNIKKKDSLNLLNLIIVLSYIVILLGVVYTDVTGFPAIRYRYLANVYILQNIFILINIERFRQNRVKKCQT